MELWKTLLKGLQNHRGSPSEHAAIPEKISRVTVGAGTIQIWFLKKPMDLKSPIDTTGGFKNIAALNISVSCVRVGRANSNRDKMLARLSDANRATKNRSKRLFIFNCMIGRKNNHHRLRVALRSRNRGKANRRSGIAPQWLSKNPSMRNMLPNLINQGLARYNK